MKSKIAEILPSVTPLEAKFLVMTLNYDTPEQQAGDNYSNAGIKEAASLFDGATARQAAGGLLSSLTSKGLGELDVEYDQFQLSDMGIQVAFACKAKS